MKIYIVADMEGIAGVVSHDQISGTSDWELENARRQFTDEICAVCSGAMEAGVDEIYVNDFHGNGRNLVIDRLPTEVMTIRGDFRPTSGFDLLDNTFGGLVLLGAHARTGSREGVLPHTYSNRLTFELFGQALGEYDLLSLVAGEHKVPTIMISGDAKTIEQASTNLPSTHTVVTKFGLGPGSALCIHPKSVVESLREGIKRAIKNIGSIELPEIRPPMQLSIRVRDPRIAERIDWIPQMKRIDEESFQFQGDSMKQLAKVVYGITMLSGI